MSLLFVTLFCQILFHHYHYNFMVTLSFCSCWKIILLNAILTDLAKAAPVLLWQCALFVYLYEVLCALYHNCPYLSIPYFIHIRKKKTLIMKELFEGLLPILLCVVLFCIYLLSKQMLSVLFRSSLSILRISWSSYYN